MRENVTALLRAQGAVFFTLPFPESEKPLLRQLSKAGLVELSSAVGHFLARSWLLAAEHPYHACTDEEGGFTLTGVPDGSYEIVCWIPNWNIERFERDPELLNVSRVWLRPPCEKSMAVRVRRGECVEVGFQAGMSDFLSGPAKNSSE